MPDGLSLEEQVIAALRRITRAIDLHSRLLLQTNGLTIPQLVALQAIQRLQPITVGALARDIHLSAATVTGILRRIEKRGLVNRTRDDLDRRSVVIELTGDGTKLVAEAPSLLQDRFNRELAKLAQCPKCIVSLPFARGIAIFICVFSLCVVVSVLVDEMSVLSKAASGTMRFRIISAVGFVAS